MHLCQDTKGHSSPPNDLYLNTGSKSIAPSTAPHSAISHALSNQRTRNFTLKLSCQNHSVISVHAILPNLNDCIRVQFGTIHIRLFPHHTFTPIRCDHLLDIVKPICLKFFHWIFSLRILLFRPFYDFWIA